MNKILKLLAYGIGGVALLIGSFITYSVLTGTPMHEMKAVGKLFPEDVEAEMAASGADAMPSPEEEREQDRRSPRQVYESAATPLGAFALQDPFSAEELRKLEVKLQAKVDALADRARALEERERELDEERAYLDDLFKRIMDLKTSLIEQRRETEAVGDELTRDEQVLEEKRSRTFAQMSALFSEMDGADAARLLTSVYGPQDGARILDQLDDDQAAELINAIHQTNADDGARYMKALQDLRAAK